METSIVDELYGGLDQGHHDSVRKYDEDSVDIYSGLEDSPKKNSERGEKDRTFLSPIGAKESLDLYEELITQEQAEKDSTYKELKGKFVAAQNQVQDLLVQLQQMRSKNSSLHNENTLLKKNICALIKTAKMEIVRKDEQINKLSKSRSSWSNFHSSAKERQHDANNRSSASLNNIAGPIKESQDLKRDKLLAEASQGRDSSLVVSTTSPSIVLRKCTGSDIAAPLNQQKKDFHSLDLSTNAIQNNRPTCSREKESTSTNPETSTKKNLCDETNHRKGVKHSGEQGTSNEKEVFAKSQNRMDKNKSERERRESSKSSCESSNSRRQQQDDPVTLRRSDRSRSPSGNADMQSRKEESRHKQRHEKQSRHTEIYDSRCEKSSSDKSHRSTEKRGTRDHHRKEERRQDSMSSSESRRTRSDGSKEYQHKKTPCEERLKSGEKNTTRGDRRSTRSETSKGHERQEAKDKGLRNNADKIRINDGKDRSCADVRENKRRTSPHHRSQNLRKVQDDGRRTSGRTVESSRKKASSSRHDCREYNYTGSDGVGKERSEEVKQSGTPDQGSNNLPDDTRTPKTSEDGNVQTDNLTSASVNSPTRLTTSSVGSGMPEEGSPKTKLTFMETLNLTISPIKKCSHPQEPAQPPPKESLSNNLTMDKSLFELVEEFCMVDEQEDDTLTLPTNTTTLHHDTNPPTSLEIKDKELEIPKGSDGNLSETRSDKVDGKDSDFTEEESIGGALVFLTDVNTKDQDSHVSMSKNEERRFICAKNSGEGDRLDDTPDESIAGNDTSQQEMATAITPSPPAKTCSNTGNAVSLEVFSTIPVKNNRQCKETLSDSDIEATQTPENSNLCPSLLKGPISEAVNINTTAQDDGVPEQTSSCDPASTEYELEISRPSQPAVVPHDEDSMMLTLSNIKVIPEAISPLTSPVRQIKKSQQQHSGKETHVKSLNKDFSTSAAVVDNDTVKMDMNKENKRPDSSVIPSVHKDPQEALSSTAIEEDLEEGEIISEPDGEGALVIQSPPIQNMSSLRNQSSPRSPRLQKKSPMRPVVTPSRKERQKKATSKDSLSLNKRRFKTVTVPPKAKISTCAEFMNMLLFIRSELRRKYMKLHKNVAKPAFCCIIEMSQASFAEYVDSVNFDTFCSQGNVVKPRLNKIIQSVMSKVSNNGIVNRIFEQQAEDLKQKLWNFVDGQFDFLFKELKAAVKRASDLSRSKSCLEDKHPNPSAKQDLDANVCGLQTKEPLNTTENRPHKKTKGDIESEGQKVPDKSIALHSFPCRGLGSSGKNIKATMEEGATTNTSSEKSLQEIVPAHENKTSNYQRRPSHSGSIQDRADFDILTEQQTSNLTFNLVTDSQMGDIFRCLLQGTDLIETGDNPNWTLNTPRKEVGENLAGLMTPNKLTPSKLITTWTSGSPYKFQMQINPALLDESCMLEIPSNAVLNESVPAMATASSQQPYSILTEDLAVSLTIPSPLKSDGHLSFLHTASGPPLSTPSNIFSAHYSEDALLDGEDATEQDIHLSLETDNSSSPSSTSGNWDTFQFKPNLPMQAEVMERSNDHFVVRIRQTCPGPQVETVEQHKGTLPNADVLPSETLDLSLPLAGGSQVTLKAGGEDNQISTKNTSDEIPAEGSTASSPRTIETQIEEPAASTDLPKDAEVAESEHVGKKDGQKMSRKHKMHHSGPKAKRSRRENSQDKQEKRRHKKRSKSSKEKNEKTPSKKIKTPSPQLSPSSLSAKNVIRKKGEVVVTWTREEDRDILVTLKTKGSSSETFATLGKKLKKSQAQIEERFTQLMKLFKKKEKMDV